MHEGTAPDLADLLTHAEGTAGALMATELVQVNENWTVSRCVREMRRQAEEVEVVHAVYVVDDHDILLGSLSLKKLLTTGARTPIAVVYDRSVRSVTSTTDEVEVARIMKKYDLFVVPVVDDMGRLLGRITIDDAPALRHHVCECFDQIEQDHQQLWQMPLRDGVQAGDGLSCWTAADASDAGDVLETPMPQAQGRYADIYDFAPVGLLSVDSQGRLIETNMAAAIQLGIPRSQCRQYRFVDFLQAESRENFEQFHREVLSGKCRRHCELGLMPGAHRPAAVVRLDATVDENGAENRMVMVDVTESHRQMAQLLHAHGHDGMPAGDAPMTDGMPWWTAGGPPATARSARMPRG